MQLHANNIGNIYCVGRNYAEHAKELNNPVPSSPIIFTKSTSSLTPFTGDIELPAQLGRCDHELEIIVLISSSGSDNFHTPDCISHIGLGLDLTRRELQQSLKDKKHPWDLAKSFEHACPVSEMIPMPDNIDLANLSLSLDINHQTRQSGSSAQMLFPILELIQFIHRHIPLKANDLIMTGTPAGVGPLEHNDHLSATLEGFVSCQAVIKRP